MHIRRNFLGEPNSARMRASALEASAVGRDRVVAMFELFRDYYENVDLEAFERDLKAKQRVILLRSNEEIVGFSTIGTFDFLYRGTNNRIIFSGDTIVRRDFWGDQTLALSWIREIGRIARQVPDRPLYWLLIVKGHRTYRYLPTFGLEFVPHWLGQPNRELSAMRDALARAMFGNCYDEESGILRFPGPRGNLVPECAMPSERERRRPDVDFFLRSNPGYVRGDELVCLCSLSRDNMRPFARRLFDQGFAG